MFDHIELWGMGGENIHRLQSSGSLYIVDLPQCRDVAMARREGRNACQYRGWTWTGTLIVVDLGALVNAFVVCVVVPEAVAAVCASLATRDP